MVQAVGGVAPMRTGGEVCRPATAPALADYRAEWRGGSLSVRLPEGMASAVRANATADAAHTHRSALLASDVYNDVAAPPPGVRVATPADLRRLGLSPNMLERPESHFRARVYVSGAPGGERYTIAFRGTENGADWKANFQQGLGRASAHYDAALKIARQIARSDADVEMVGHSLGGGLAATAAMASGRHAVTFNAAGLHDNTKAQATAIAQGVGKATGSTDNYRVPGEILTFVQEGGDRVIGGVFGGLPGAYLADAPPAVGRQHELAGEVPAGKGFFAEHSRIDRHGMDWVLASTAAQAGR